MTLIASGTATLEAALFKRPMVIAYTMHALSWQMMKRMHYQPWVGLPNILCATSWCPSCCSATPRPEKLAAAAIAWLDDPAACEALRGRASRRAPRAAARHRPPATDAIAAVLEA